MALHLCLSLIQMIQNDCHFTGEKNKSAMQLDFSTVCEGRLFLPCLTAVLEHYELSPS